MLNSLGPFPIDWPFTTLKTKPITKKEPHSCENINGLNLCPIRIGLGKSRITAIGTQVQDGQLVGWNAQGWCGLAHDVLEIDFGQEYNIKMVKVGCSRILDLIFITDSRSVLSPDSNNITLILIEYLFFELLASDWSIFQFL